MRDEGRHNIIVAGLSYGQGSSREHAAICPMYLGVRAVIARSFERIHTANLVNFGILPLTFREERDYGAVDAGDRLEIEGIRGLLQKREGVTVRNLTKGITFETDYQLTERQIGILLAGGALNYHGTV